MSWNLFIDDEREPKDVTWAPFEIRLRYCKGEWVIARSYTDAIVEVLNRGFPKFISFDHDLGDSYSGYDIAKQLVDNDIISGDLVSRRGYTFCSDFDFYVHSQNPIGKRNIESYLNNYLKFKRGN